MQVSFFPATQILAKQRDELRDALDRVLSSGHMVLGPEVDAFESEFAEFCGARYCVSVGTGLDALAIALRSSGIGPGDEVLVPGHTFIATWLAVTQTGARPIGIDVDPNTFNMDPDLLEASITPKTVGIIPVHLYGQPAPMDSINAVAKKHGLFVLEDAAQAHGARYKGRRTGVLGDAAAFSFYPTKNLGALGDGGAIVTNDEALAKSAREYRNYGSSIKYQHETLGSNSRLDEIQAAFLRLHLRELNANNERRRYAASLYDQRLVDSTGVILPTVVRDVEHVYHLYVVRTRHRDELARGLAALGIQTLIHYPRPPHLQPAYVTGETPIQFLPNSETLSGDVLSLPMWPGLDVSQIDMVGEAIATVMNRLN